MNTKLKRLLELATNIPVTFRYFVVESGPAFDAIQECLQARRAAHKAYLAFAKKYGMKEIYGGSRLVAIGSKSKMSAYPTGWRRFQEDLRFMVPDKKTAEGKKIAKEMAALPDCPAYQGCLGVVGLHWHPTVMDGSQWFSATVSGADISKKAVIRVPWKEYPQELLDLYLKQKNYGSCDLDFVAEWKPHETMREVKEWEALKMYDDDKEANKEKKNEG